MLVVAIVVGLGPSYRVLIGPSYLILHLIGYHHLQHLTQSTDGPK